MRPRGDPPRAQALWPRLSGRALRAVVGHARRLIEAGACAAARPAASHLPAEQADLAARLAQAARAADGTLGLQPFDTQLMAAAAMLGGQLAEMATGEGKTLAMALAAAVAARAGAPVHVVTANAYLAARDAAWLTPFYAALGLRVAALRPGEDEAQRRAAHGHHVVYATASELAFDHLRDHLACPALTGGPGDALRHHLRALGARAPQGTAEDGQAPRGLLGRAQAPHGTAAGTPVGTPATRGPRDGTPAPPGEARPLLPGLCVALLDEADSILLDEAGVPLVLSRQRPHAARRAFLWQALALARQLGPAHYGLDATARRAWLTEAGQQAVAELSAAWGGPWLRRRYREEALATALTALHLCRRDVHYLVRPADQSAHGSADGAADAPAAPHPAAHRQGPAARGPRIELLDELTGRPAPGRVWPRGLHTAVEIKEGCPPGDDSETVAQITYPRFFGRYLLLGGMSGTLWEARGELRRVHGLPVVRIPLRRPSRLRRLPTRWVDGEPWGLLARHVRALSAAGRPVLVGTDSVADSEALSAALQRLGQPHAVLNARQDAQEAAIVAAAGRAGQVTVATRMAGRGTDIALDEPARQAGGLHVIHCQRNPNRRMDRQLIGRAARQGAPGSAERWLWRRPAVAPAGAAPSAASQRTAAPPGQGPAPAETACPAHGASPGAAHARSAPAFISAAGCRNHDLDTDGERAGRGGPWLGAWQRAWQRWAGAWARVRTALAQRWQEQRQALLRRHLLEQDKEWERQQARAGQRTGPPA
ncbi:MAG: preprotein translocase subunit SecA [Pseudomonadota bacterium]